MEEQDPPHPGQRFQIPIAAEEPGFLDEKRVDDIPATAGPEQSRLTTTESTQLPGLLSATPMFGSRRRRRGLRPLRMSSGHLRILTAFSRRLRGPSAVAADPTNDNPTSASAESLPV